ncbi:MAG TPA: hypothetical protein ENJ80_11410 [Gammaproteobacteria bacterium]|nr:hypothetical protein [Gammaproteobacteria bacterium]
MNKHLFVLLAVFAGTGLLSGCGEEPAPEPEAAGTTDAPQPVHQPAHGVAPETTGSKLYGSVVETFDAGGFTYVLLDSGKEQFWAAGPLTRLVPGTMVAIFSQMPMENYHSKNLDRDFELIYFTDKIITDAHQEESDEAADTMQPHADIARTLTSGPVSGVSKAEGGKTIAEIIAQKNELAGKTVRVRGKVVKYTAEVLGHNWIHIMDGSSSTDLTVTTDGTAAVGDVIVAEGILGLGKDFGYGYVYELILEDAGISKD